jgi:hypothetical protein
MIKSDRHDRGWPRFSLTVTTGSSDQSHRIYVRCQGQIDSHDARGPEWEGVQYRRFKALPVELCEGCPPLGYPTDETRCLSCPRRSLQ